MEDGTRLTTALGNSISATDYTAAIRMNQHIGRILGQFHQHYDVLLAPPLSSPPVPVGYISEAPPHEYGSRFFGFMGDAGIYNQAGQPSVSLPLCSGSDGLPMGMMFSAAYGNDDLLLQLAGQLERYVPWWKKRPPVHTGHKVLP